MLSFLRTCLDRLMTLLTKTINMASRDSRGKALIRLGVLLAIREMGKMSLREIDLIYLIIVTGFIYKYEAV